MPYVDDYIQEGDSDDTAGIQRAIDAVSDHTPINYAPELILTPERTYDVSSTILIPYGVRVMAHGSVIQSTVSDNQPTIQWGDATYKPWVGSWHGGTIATSVVGSTGIGMKVDRANHGLVEDIRIGGFGVGIALDGTDPVQWELHRCFVSGSKTVGIRANRANVLRIVGGKIHCKNNPGAIGLHVASSASVSVDSLDISICEAGAMLLDRCSGVDVRSLYTERCGGVANNDGAVVTVTRCLGFSFSGCRFNAANGTVTGANSLAWGIDIDDSNGGSITGCMSNTARKGFARITDSHDVDVSGCTDNYFEAVKPRIERNDKSPAGEELVKPTWQSGVTIIRGITVDGSEITFAGGNPDSVGYIDFACDYDAGDTIQVNAIFDVLATSAGNKSIVKSDLPVCLAWMQNPAQLTDNNKSDPVTLIPLRVGNVHDIRQEWTTTTAGTAVRLYIGSRQHWPGFTVKPRFLSMRKVA